MEGNLEVAKEQLTTYFQAQDAEITQEQASYLANFSMKVLKTAGQIAVHQVAAKRFHVARKGVKRRGEMKGAVEEGASVRGTVIQQIFKNLGSMKGVGTLGANKILKSNGFVFKGRTPGGYYK